MKHGVYSIYIDVPQRRFDEPGSRRPRRSEPLLQ